MTKNGTIDYRMGEVETDVKDIKEEMKIIRTNELAHIKDDLTEVKTDVAWLKRWFFLIASASVGGLVTGLLNLLR